MPPNLHHMWLLPLGGREGHHPGQAPVRQVQSGSLALSGHWTPWNKGGLCSLPGCWNTENSHKGTVESLLLSCPSLSSTRDDLVHLTWSYLIRFPQLSPVIRSCLTLDPVQFWLDCSSMAPVISAIQQYGEGVLQPLYRLSRNYCHVLHKARVSLLSDD